MIRVERPPEPETFDETCRQPDNRWLREHGVLVSVEEGKGRQSAIYMFAELLNPAEGKSIA